MGKKTVTKQDVERRLRRRGWIRLRGELIKGKWGVTLCDLDGPVALPGIADSDDALAAITPTAIVYPYGPEEDVATVAEAIRRAMN